MEQSYKEHVKINQSRVGDILEREGLETIVIHSGKEKYLFLDDMTDAFKVNPLFKAWLPLIENPNCWLILNGKDKPELAFYQPVDFWHSVPKDPSGYWVEHFKISKMSKEDDIKSILPSSKDNCVYLGEFTEDAKKLGFTKINTKSVLNYFHYHRAYKTDYEYECIRSANKLAIKGHVAAKGTFYAGGSEFDIALAYQAAVGQNINELPYGLIIALNSNGAVLHYMKHSLEKFNKDSLHSFLIDGGASFNGYAADISRTYSFKDDEFSDLIKRVNKSQLEIINSYKLGESYAYAQVESIKHIANILSEFNFINLPGEEIVSKNLVRIFYPHGLGHHLGLQVHDVGAKLASDCGKEVMPPKEHPHMRATRILEERMVYTVEPGLYFIESLLSEVRGTDNEQYFNWKKIEEFKKYGGIRIEDNLILHSGRIENITRDLGLE